MAVTLDENGYVKQIDDRQVAPKHREPKGLLDYLKHKDISSAFVGIEEDEPQEIVFEEHTLPLPEKKLSVKPKDIIDELLKHRDDLVSFSKRVFPDYHMSKGKPTEPSPLHYKLSNLLIKTEDSVALAFPREFAKTTYLTVFFFAWNLVFAKYKYIVYVSSSEDNASEQLRNAVTELVSHPILKGLIKTVRRDNSTIFEYENYAGETFKIKCIGVGGRIRGTRYGANRPDIIIVDDIEDRKLIKNESYRAEIRQWFNTDVKGLSANARIFLSGTIVHDDSLLNNMIKNPPIQPKFVAFLYGITDDDGNSNWETMFPIELINRMEEDARNQHELDAFYMERHNICVAPENQIFKQEYFKEYTDDMFNSIKGNCYYFTAIDLASSTGERADYTAIVTVAVNSDNYWFIADVTYGRWDSDERIKRIFEVYRKFNPLAIGIERGIIYNEMLKNMQREMFATNTFINFTELSPYGRGQSKELRITESLQARYKMGQIWHKEKAHWDKELTLELKLFPKYGHDDIIDALSYISDIAYAPTGVYNTYSSEIRNPGMV